MRLHYRYHACTRMQAYRYRRIVSDVKTTASTTYWTQGCRPARDAGAKCAWRVLPAASFTDQPSAMGFIRRTSYLWPPIMCLCSSWRRRCCQGTTRCPLPFEFVDAEGRPCHWLLGKFELPRVGVDVSNLGSAYHFFVPLLEVLNTSSMVFSELYLLRCPSTAGAAPPCGWVSCFLFICFFWTLGFRGGERAIQEPRRVRNRLCGRHTSHAAGITKPLPSSSVVCAARDSPMDTTPSSVESTD